MKKVIGSINRKLLKESEKKSSSQYITNMLKIHRDKIAAFFNVDDVQELTLFPFMPVLGSDAKRSAVIKGTEGVGAIEVDPKSEEISCLSLEYLEKSFKFTENEPILPVETEKKSRNIEYDLVYNVQKYIKEGSDPKIKNRCEQVLMAFDDEFVKYVELDSKFGGK